MYDEITALLKAYPAKKIKIAQLRFELEHPALIGEKELIDSLSLGNHPRDNGGPRTGHISDRTMAIALQYQDLTQSLNNETVAGILRELRALEAETEKLDFYISLLDKRKSRIIRLYYFDGKTLEQTIAETQAAKRTVIKYRAAALRELTDMYAFIDRVKGEKREAGDGK